MSSSSSVDGTACAAALTVYALTKTGSSFVRRGATFRTPGPGPETHRADQMQSAARRLAPQQRAATRTTRGLIAGCPSAHLGRGGAVKERRRARDVQRQLEAVASRRLRRHAPDRAARGRGRAQGSSDASGQHASHTNTWPIYKAVEAYLAAAHALVRFLSANASTPCPVSVGQPSQVGGRARPSTGTTR